MDFSLLCKSVGLSNKTLLEIFESYCSLEEFLHAPLGEIERLVGKAPFGAIRRWRSSAKLPEAYLANKSILDALGVNSLSLKDEAYPVLLSQIASPPAVLFVRGDMDALALPQVAIVGSRRATAQGTLMAEQFSQQLASAGFIITSGLALGIDAAAHQGALNAGTPTIAVMGTGIDQVYPARHRQLAEAILQSGGALLTEHMPGSPPKAEHFPRRNRIVTGMSLGVLVVEASERSGSLISARLAAEQGREVCVIPGSLHSPVSAGCHRLIREGAILVTSADQVVEQLGSLLGFQRQDTQEQASLESTESSHWLLTIMGYDPCTPDQLCLMSDRSIADITAALAELEMDGKVAQTQYGYQRIS